jgi:CTP synthase
VKKQPKYIFVSGGVLSGLGKGITAASVARLLKARGLTVNLQKCDPYLNVDAGTLNPREHGECFVTKDGAETDLDLGHYERFVDEELTQQSSLMSGRVLLKVIEDERNGKYQGQTVQIVPHVMTAIQDYIRAAAKGFDVHIIEIGGTVGDLESQSFIEAFRELGLREGLENCLYLHVVYMPYLAASHEFKTKPAQNAVRDLRSAGIAPDIIAVRSEEPAPVGVKRKLSLFCGVEDSAIALLPNAKTIYEVPLTLEDQGIANVICEKLGLKGKAPDLGEWRKLVKSALKPYKHTVKIGVVAKYMDNQDTYMSVFEALKAAGWANDVGMSMEWIPAEDFDEQEGIEERLDVVDGIVVPGGFGSRGVEGKIKAARYALKTGKPYLGLCLGMQVGVIAAARNAGLTEANSAEFAPDAKDVLITTMADQHGKENTGGTMRLGNYPCVLEKASKTAACYGTTRITERHRHRYEANNDYRGQYERWGIRSVGLSPNKKLVEVIEGIDHPFFVASQFHPEFTSRPNRAHPLFKGFVAAVVAKQRRIR